MPSQPPNPGGPPSVRKFGPFRIYKTPDGKRHIAFGEVDPNDPNIKMLVEQSGGVIFTGDKHNDIGIGVFPYKVKIGLQKNLLQTRGKSKVKYD
jgi:hypothetical protein